MSEMTTMINKGLTVKPELIQRKYEREKSQQRETARNHIPRSPMALIILLFDFLIKIDPR
jgi:hypothetical protein